MTKLILSGACGRMGRMISALAKENGVEIIAGIDVNTSGDTSYPIYPSFEMLPKSIQADAVLDFTRAENLSNVLSFAMQRCLPTVLAATGYNEKDFEAMRDAAKTIPIFQSANMSLGVYVLKFLAKQAAQMLPGFDIEIVEKHHNQKLDAPSGTAIMLYNAVANDDSEPVYGRHERTERREKNEIGILSVRGGTVPGEHEVGFYGPGETVLLTHSAQDRSIFALGALQAVKFVSGQAPGMYDMDRMFSSTHQ